MRIRHAAMTHVGMKRDHNEDSHVVRPDLGLFMVADGMGGHNGGEHASRVSITTVEEEVSRSREQRPEAFAGKGPLPESPVADILRQALETACSKVWRAAKADPALEGMGTTSTALLIAGGQAIAGHVGDSRFYMVRAGHIQLISEDHSLVQEQVKAGILTPEQARASRFKNIITRSIGFEEDVLVDVMGVAVQPGDQFLLCSDGLSNLVEEHELREMLDAGPLEDVPAKLVDLANARGGDDNITVIVLQADADEAVAAAPAPAPVPAPVPESPAPTAAAAAPAAASAASEAPSAAPAAASPATEAPATEAAPAAAKDGAAA